MKLSTIFALVSIACVQAVQHGLPTGQREHTRQKKIDVIVSKIMHTAQQVEQKRLAVLRQRTAVAVAEKNRTEQAVKEREEARRQAQMREQKCVAQEKEEIERGESERADAITRRVIAAKKEQEEYAVYKKYMEAERSRKAVLASGRLVSAKQAVEKAVQKKNEAIQVKNNAIVRLAQARHAVTTLVAPDTKVQEAELAHSVQRMTILERTIVDKEKQLNALRMRVQKTERSDVKKCEAFDALAHATQEVEDIRKLLASVAVEPSAVGRQLTTVMPNQEYTCTSAATVFAQEYTRFDVLQTVVDNAQRVVSDADKRLSHVRKDATAVISKVIGSNAQVGIRQATPVPNSITHVLQRLERSEKAYALACKRLSAARKALDDAHGTCVPLPQGVALDVQRVGVDERMQQLFVSLPESEWMRVRLEHKLAVAEKKKRDAAILYAQETELYVQSEVDKQTVVHVQCACDSMRESLLCEREKMGQLVQAISRIHTYAKEREEAVLAALCEAVNTEYAARVEIQRTSREYAVAHAYAAEVELLAHCVEQTPALMVMPVHVSPHASEQLLQVDDVVLCARSLADSVMCSHFAYCDSQLLSRDILSVHRARTGKSGVDPIILGWIIYFLVGDCMRVYKEFPEKIQLLPRAVQELIRAGIRSYIGCMIRDMHKDPAVYQECLTRLIRMEIMATTTVDELSTQARAMVGVLADPDNEDVLGVAVQAGVPRDCIAECIAVPVVKLVRSVAVPGAIGHEQMARAQGCLSVQAEKMQALACIMQCWLAQQK